MHSQQTYIGRFVMVYEQQKQPNNKTSENSRFTIININDIKDTDKLMYIINRKISNLIKKELQKR